MVLDIKSSKRIVGNVMKELSAKMISTLRKALISPISTPMTDIVLSDNEPDDRILFTRDATCVDISSDCGKCNIGDIIDFEEGLIVINGISRFTKPDLFNKTFNLRDCIPIRSIYGSESCEIVVDTSRADPSLVLTETESKCKPSFEEMSSRVVGKVIGMNGRIALLIPEPVILDVSGVTSISIDLSNEFLLATLEPNSILETDMGTSRGPP